MLLQLLADRPDGPFGEPVGTDDFLGFETKIEHGSDVDAVALGNA